MLKHGYIYKLCIRDGSLDDCYIGSTFNLQVRKAKHRSNCRTGHEKGCNHIYEFIRANGGMDNWTFLILEEGEFEDKQELLRRERHHIEHLKPTLNRVVPIRTRDEIKNYKEQWYNDNQDKVLASRARIDKTKKSACDKAYREKKGEELLAKKRIYHSEKVKCEDCGVELRRDSLRKHRMAFHTNTIMTTCEDCGVELRRDSLAKHKQTFHTEDRGLVKCDICDKSMHVNSLIKHKKAMHTEGRGRVKCDVCDKEISRDNLSKHKKSVHERVRLECG